MKRYIKSNLSEYYQYGSGRIDDPYGFYTIYHNVDDNREEWVCTCRNVEQGTRLIKSLVEADRLPFNSTCTLKDRNEMPVGTYYIDDVGNITFGARDYAKSYITYK